MDIYQEKRFVISREELQGMLKDHVRRTFKDCDLSQTQEIDIYFEDDGQSKVFIEQVVVKISDWS